MYLKTGIDFVYSLNNLGSSNSTCFTEENVTVTNSTMAWIVLLLTGFICVTTVSKFISKVFDAKQYHQRKTKQEII